MFTYFKQQTTYINSRSISGQNTAHKIKQQHVVSKNIKQNLVLNTATKSIEHDREGTITMCIQGCVLGVIVVGD